MIGFTIQEAKERFLDWQKVQDAAKSASLRALSRFGAFVRQRAKTSMRKRKGISEPGEPPSAHVGLMRDMMFFVVEPEVPNVVIGPAKINKPIPMIMQALEHGGESLATVTRGKLKGTLVPVRIEARPFMQPAFDAEIKKAPYLWENSIRPHG